jgi:hypothetical protein
MPKLLATLGVLAAVVAAIVLVPRPHHAAPPPAPARFDVPRIAARVETLRGLRFRTQPSPVRVSGAQARREGLADVDRSEPAPRRRADEEVLKLLGLIGPRADLRDIEASVFGEGVAGYYDPRTKRLRIVDSPATGSKVLGEVTLAHELTHALEDQRFGLADSSGDGDRALARTALVEGSATMVMEQYLVRYFGAGQALAGVLGSGLDSTPKLPRFIQDQLLFPYLDGMRFVQALRDRAGGRWTLVNLADRVRPPESSAQVLHPEQWLRVETPRAVPLAPRLGPGWRRAATGTWGEWATGELLADARAAIGWRGDRYALYQRPAPGCAAPCRRADVLVMRWRWATPGDARRFRAALTRWAAGRDGAVVVNRSGAVTLALAPTAALARRAAAG